MLGIRKHQLELAKEKKERLAMRAATTGGSLWKLGPKLKSGTAALQHCNILILASTMPVTLTNSRVQQPGVLSVAVRRCNVS